MVQQMKVLHSWIRYVFLLLNSRTNGFNFSFTLADIKTSQYSSSWNFTVSCAVISCVSRLQQNNPQIISAIGKINNLKNILSNEDSDFQSKKMSESSILTRIFIIQFYKNAINFCLSLSPFKQSITNNFPMKTHLNYDYNSQSKYMIGCAPKGSYHNYCRKAHSLQPSQNTHRIRTTRNQLSKRPQNHLQQFTQFQDYLRFLQSKQKAQSQSRPKTTDYRSALTSRPMTQALTRDIKIKIEDKQQKELIKPYFPFFKCRLENGREEKSEAQFRVNSQKFKLNYRIIEENMGKGDGRNTLFDD